MLLALAAALCLTAAPAQEAPDDDPCDRLRTLQRETYDFSPQELSSDEQEAVGARMDTFWDVVMADRETLAPCLRELLLESADPWFRFDGAALLVTAKPSDETRALQVTLWSEADLDDVDRQYWLETLAIRGSEGHDVSRAADRWLRHEGAHYTVAEHGMFTVGAHEGAMFLFGSMDEETATPALLRIVRDEAHPGRGIALVLLALQATPRAWRALGAIDAETVPPREAAVLEQFTTQAPQPPVGGKATVTFSRERILEDLRANLGEEGAEFIMPPPSFPDWVINAADQLEPEDLPLLRQARRRSVTLGSDEAVQEYFKFSVTLQLLTWKAEYFEP